jgi:hypothetical protein
MRSFYATRGLRKCAAFIVARGRAWQRPTAKKYRSQPCARPWERCTDCRSVAAEGHDRQPAQRHYFKQHGTNFAIVFPCHILQTETRPGWLSAFSHPVTRLNLYHSLHCKELTMSTKYNEGQLHELLYQALETEIGGIDVYQQAIECAQHDELREEWQEYLKETQKHRKVLLELFSALGLDADKRTSGREVVSYHALSLIEAMRMARNAGDSAAAELVATECVVLAETKDHLNWQLIGHVAEHGTGSATKHLAKAYEEVEDEEDHHLYHTRGWSRELWIKSLGLSAVLPPPEEVKHVETAIGASRAEQAREQML